MDEARRAMDHLRGLDPALRVSSLSFGCRSTDRNISPPSPTDCEKLDCQSDNSASPIRKPLICAFFAAIIAASSRPERK
jgi:hypothetical protein